MPVRDCCACGLLSPILFYATMNVLRDEFLRISPRFRILVYVIVCAVRDIVMCVCVCMRTCVCIHNIMFTSPWRKDTFSLRVDPNGEIGFPPVNLWTKQK